MAHARLQAEYGAASGIMALLANVNRDPKKSKPFSPDDFNPFAERNGRRSNDEYWPPCKQNWDLLEAKFKKKEK